MITIITPTYNRAYILGAAYKSLCEQTNQEFEWIIVDDGSLDNTESLVNSWMEKTSFPIIYKKQENGGKHRALNKGIALANSEYILILDSDDYLTINAVERIHQWVRSINHLDDFAGVAGLRGWKDKESAIGQDFGENIYIDATNLERRKLKMMGDKAEVYKTALLKKYPFPEFEGENFLREMAVWDRIAKDGYKIRWFNEIIYKSEYLQDGLTKNTNNEKLLKNFQGHTYCTRLYIETRGLFLSLLQIGRYTRLAKQVGKSQKEICKLLEVGKIKFLGARFIYFLWRMIGKV